VKALTRYAIKSRINVEITLAALFDGLQGYRCHNRGNIAIADDIHLPASRQGNATFWRDPQRPQRNSQVRTATRPLPNRMCLPPSSKVDQAISIRQSLEVLLDPCPVRLELVPGHYLYLHANLAAAYTPHQPPKPTSLLTAVSCKTRTAVRSGRTISISFHQARYRLVIPLPLLPSIHSPHSQLRHGTTAKLDTLRKVYHRAVQIPLDNIEAL
jgi:hypothetical protein